MKLSKGKKTDTITEHTYHHESNNQRWQDRVRRTRRVIVPRLRVIQSASKQKRYYSRINRERDRPKQLHRSYKVNTKPTANQARVLLK